MFDSTECPSNQTLYLLDDISILSRNHGTRSEDSHVHEKHSKEISNLLKTQGRVGNIMATVIRDRRGKEIESVLCVRPERIEVMLWCILPFIASGFLDWRTRFYFYMNVEILFPLESYKCFFAIYIKNLSYLYLCIIIYIFKNIKIIKKYNIYQDLKKKNYLLTEYKRLE